MTAELADTPFTPLSVALERLEQVVSPMVGIVTATAQRTYWTNDCRLVHTCCQTASSLRVLGAGSPSYSGCAHPSARRARAAAIGEAVERYSAAFVPEVRLVTTTAAELGAQAVAPERFALFHKRQLEAPRFPFRAFTRESRLNFVQGFALTDGRAAFLPAQLVFITRPAADEADIGYATSNGLAAGPTLEEAILSGLFELIERDVFMITWKNQLSLPLLDWSDDPTMCALDRQHFGPSGLRYAVLDGSAFFDVPVAVAVVHGPPGEQTALAVGGGCAASVAEAWLKALSEAFAVHRWLIEETFQAPDRPDLSSDEVQTFDDHMFFYARHERAESAAFLDRASQRTPARSVRAIDGATPLEQIRTLTARLAACDTSPYAVDVTTPEIQDVGLRVARVIAPELCPLDVAHTLRFLGGTRLYSAAAEAGVSSSRLTVDELNPRPHPFP